MGEWKEYKLGEVLTFQRGYDLPKSEMNGGDIPVAGSNGVIGYHNQYTTKGPGITIGRSGNIGVPRFYEDNFWAHNTTLFVKDFHGNDIAGTNTEIEKVLTGSFKKGDVVVCEFRQKIPVAAGKYTLSFSCTKYNLKGELEVLNRKYDALLIEVMTTKNTVGIIRIDSDISIKKITK